MTVKERLHHLVEELPEDELQTVEQLLQPFAKAPGELRNDGPQIGTLLFRTGDIQPSDDPEERIRALNRFIRNRPKSTYLLTDEDVSRERFYEGRP